MIEAEKQGLRPTKQSNGKVSIWEFLGGTRSSEIDIEEKFRCIVGRDGDSGIGIREKIDGFLKARGNEVEVAKVVLDETGFVVEGSGLDGRRWNAEDIAGKGEDIGGDVAELGEVERERRRRRGAEFGIEVGEVDVGVPETVTELKKTVFFSFSFSFFSRFFLFSFNYQFFFKKKMQNGVVSMGLMAAINWVVMEPYIDKNWKSEDWIDKTES